MAEYKWQLKEAIKQVKVKHKDSKKFNVDTSLTMDKVYDVVNETEEYLFIVDDHQKIGGFYKTYFDEV